jgi:hypothetical protein
MPRTWVCFAVLTEIRIYRLQPNLPLHVFFYLDLCAGLHIACCLLPQQYIELLPLVVTSSPSVGSFTDFIQYTHRHQQPVLEQLLDLPLQHLLERCLQLLPRARSLFFYLCALPALCS